MRKNATGPGSGSDELWEGPILAGAGTGGSLRGILKR